MLLVDVKIAIANVWVMKVRNIFHLCFAIFSKEKVTFFERFVQNNPEHQLRFSAS